MGAGLLKNGVNKATDNLNAVGLFISDFILDEGEKGDKKWQVKKTSLWKIIVNYV